METGESERTHLMEIVKEYLSALVQAEGKLADFKAVLELKNSEIRMLRENLKPGNEIFLQEELRNCRMKIGELNRENTEMKAFIQNLLEVKQFQGKISAFSDSFETKDTQKALEIALAELAKVTEERNTLKSVKIPKLEGIIRLNQLEITSLSSKLSQNSVKTASVSTQTSVLSGNFHPSMQRKQKPKLVHLIPSSSFHPRV